MTYEISQQVRPDPIGISLAIKSSMVSLVRIKWALSLSTKTSAGRGRVL